MGPGGDITLHQDDGNAKDTACKLIAATNKHRKPIVLLEMSPKYPNGPSVTGYI